MTANRFKWFERHEGGHRGVMLLWIVLMGGSVVGWGWAVRRQLTTGAPPPAPLATVVLSEPALLSPVEMARLLEGGPAGSAPEPVQRFQLLGVIADASGGGVALIAVDGQPPRPFVLGAEVAPGWVLQRLSPREVMLAGTQGAPIRLTLPAWEPRSTEAAATGEAAAAPNGPGPVGDSAGRQPAHRGDSRRP